MDGYLGPAQRLAGLEAALAGDKPVVRRDDDRVQPAHVLYAVRERGQVAMSLRCRVPTCIESTRRAITAVEVPAGHYRPREFPAKFASGPRSLTDMGARMSPAGG